MNKLIESLKKSYGNVIIIALTIILILFKPEIKKFGRAALRSFNNEHSIQFPDKMKE